MDRFEAMRAYVHVVDSGSYTRAARQLNVHKATVSQQIQQLEQQLGVRLLTRTTRSVAPTPEGLDYYRHACAIVQQVEQAESHLRKGVSAPAGHLRVNVPVALARQVFVPEVRGFLQRYPKLTLELGCSDRTIDLVQEGVDCTVRGGDLPDSGLVARRLGELRFVLCAAPRYIDDDNLLSSVWNTLKAPPLQAIVRFGAPQSSVGRDRRAWARALRDDVQRLRDETR